MNDQFQADNNLGKDTLTGTAPEEQTNYDANASKQDTGDTGGSGEIMIPKHRFDEVNAKVKALQEQVSKQAEGSKQALDVQQKLAAVFAPTNQAQDPDLKKLLDMGLTEDTIETLGKVFSKRAVGAVEDRIRPLQSSNAEMHFRSEVSELKSKFPAIAEWDNDKMTELRKVYATEERYRGLSLEEIVKLKFPEATTKTGSSYTAEASHGRTANTQGEKPVADMNEEEFNKYLISKGAQKSVKK